MLYSIQYNIVDNIIFIDIIYTTQTCMYVCMYICVYVCVYVCNSVTL